MTINPLLFMQSVHEFYDLHTNQKLITSRRKHEENYGKIFGKIP